MKVAQAVGVVVGIALMAAPAAAGYAGSTASDIHRSLGPVAASLALIAAWEATRAVRWPNVVIGAVLVVAPAVVDHSGAAAAVGEVSGVLLAATAPFAGPTRRRTRGGWRSLVETRQKT